MRKPGVYYHKTSGYIWLVEGIEYYHKGYNTEEFSIITRGCWNGREEFNRCLIMHDDFKKFVYLGKFK